MWISRKKFKALEKRVADLERQVQGQQEANTDVGFKIDCEHLNLKNVPVVLQSLNCEV